MLLCAIAKNTARILVLAVLCGWFAFACTMRAAEIDDHHELFRQLVTTYCLDCHSGRDAEARLDLSSLSAATVTQQSCADWRRVVRVLRDQTMPPEDSEQPTRDELAAACAGVENTLQHAISTAASEPGPSLLRRITNAEFDYCIHDLTGLQLNLEKLLVADSVGGSGFTNSGTAQFMQEATLERYFEVAKLVADHAVIGAGPIYFYDDPGLTGMELSSIRRIQAIYRQHGFRAAAGEGAKPFGLESFATAFHVAWQFKYRDALNQDADTIDEFAIDAGISSRFALHIWNVLNQEQARFPLSNIIESWNQFPPPADADGRHEEVISRKSKELFAEMQAWQQRFAGSALD